MSWFDCKITYEKEINQSGKIRKVSENYLVDAESFTDAETILGSLVFEKSRRRNHIVKSIQKMNLYDLFLDRKSDKYYKCKVGFITLDELSGEEKIKYSFFLVQADSVGLALDTLEKTLFKETTSFEIHTIAETDILEVKE